MKNLILGLLLMVLAQTLTWFQANGQFVWKWAKEHPIIISLVAGSTISYMFIKSIGMIVSYYDGLLWPSRFMSFALGIFVFGFLTHHIMGEGINLKTFVSLGLAFALILVQLFWK